MDLTLDLDPEVNNCCFGNADIKKIRVLDVSMADCVLAMLETTSRPSVRATTPWVTDFI